MAQIVRVRMDLCAGSQVRGRAKGNTYIPTHLHTHTYIHIFMLTFVTCLYVLLPFYILVCTPPPPPSLTKPIKGFGVSFRSVWAYLWWCKSGPEPIEPGELGGLCPLPLSGFMRGLTAIRGSCSKIVFEQEDVGLQIYTQSLRNYA